MSDTSLQERRRQAAYAVEDSAREIARVITRGTGSIYWVRNHALPGLLREIKELERAL